MMDTPRFLHCFSAEVVPNPELMSTTAKMAVEYQVTERRVPVGSSSTVKFRLTDPRSGLPARDLADVTVLYYRSDGRGRTVVPARALQDGGYEATVKLHIASTYYLFVGSKSSDLEYTDLPFFSLMGVPAPAAAAEPAELANTEGSSVP